MIEGWGQEQFLRFFDEKKRPKKGPFPVSLKCPKCAEPWVASIPIWSIPVQGKTLVHTKWRRGTKGGPALNRPLWMRDRHASSTSRLRSQPAGTKILVGFEAACSHTC
jgi:hypothetical protein